jgi:DNA end-binding protein Ku
MLNPCGRRFCGVYEVMPPRSIGNASISFGLKQQYICSQEGTIVEKDDMVKGYEFSKGQYVRFSPEEIKALDEKATNSIDIAEFVPLAAVDRIYLDKVYYLGPDKGGDRAYRLLGEALKATGRAALGQYSARGKQHLVLIRPLDGVLIMEQLHYAGELRPSTEIPHPETPVKETELALARLLIQQSSNDEFRPEQYHDTVRERVLEAIQQKVEGQEITAEAAPSETKILDLMDALKASLAKNGGGAGEKKPAMRISPQTEPEEEEAPRKRKVRSG